MKTTLFLPLAVLMAAAAAAQNPAEPAVPALEHAIEHAHLTGVESDLAPTVRKLDAALAAEPDNPALLYECAFAHYAATAALRAAKDNDGIEAEFERATSLLERVHGQPWEAEAEAFEGSILGELIGIKGGLSAMKLGPKSGRLLGSAARTLPNGPRVLLFRGISLLNTPKMFGGDPVLAETLLQRSAAAFAAADSNAAGPHWGHADALAWLGVAKKQRGDVAAALAAWRQALALEPDFGWVKFALMPSVAQNPKP